VSVGKGRAGSAWLIGSSMGGGIALDAALTWPGRFAGLVVLAPPISGEPEDDDAGLDPVSEQLFGELQAAYRADDVTAANRWHTRIWLDGPLQPEGRVGGEARRLALEMNEIILRNELAEGALPESESGGSGVDAWHRLAELALPVTVACGEFDVPHLLAQCRWLAGQLPQARLQWLTGTAHLPYLDQPGQVADVIRETLAG
jgi:pimeloyl-ACP methyl ester carboxylesterase